MTKLTDAQKRAMKKYAQKIITKKASFNTEKDEAIIKYLNKIPNFTKWVREQVEKEINK